MDEKYKIHAFYIISILISVIITLLTVKWAKIPGLADYLTFALTVSSLCLALLAIIYSIYSNTSFSQNIKSLENSNQLLSNTSTKLSSVTAELNDKVETLPKIIKTVGDRVEETHHLITDLSKKPIKSQPLSTITPSSNSIPKNILNDFLSNSSFNGLLSLRMLALSYKTKTPFDFSETMKIARFDKNYCLGFIVAIASLGLVDYKEKNDIYTVNEIDSHLEANVSGALSTKAKEISDSEDFARELNEIIAEVEAVFEEDVN